MALPAAAYAWLGWSRRWVAEDAFIDLRIVRHLLAGHGPVFNVGERVEAYTSPLWVGILALAAASVRLFSGPDGPLEWIAVSLGLLCAVFGLGAAIAAGVQRSRASGPVGPVLPLGALVVVATAAYWDFATSGLETGLIFAWLGLSSLALAGARPPSGQRSRRRAVLAALLFGLGPLVRPDLAVLSAVFLVLLIVLLGWSAAQVAALAAPAAVLSVAYQMFRMGYFSAVVPNTAIAKEAGVARWDQGWHYLTDFIGPYWLMLPAGALLWYWLVDLSVLLRGRYWRAAALAALPVAGGVLHAAYVVRVGGDFMHGRMLLPSLFAALLPVMAVVLPTSSIAPFVARNAARFNQRRWPALFAACVVMPWAVVCALWLRPPYHRLGNGVGPQGIADERWFYVRLSARSWPITLADYDAAAWKQRGDAFRRLAERERALVLESEEETANAAGRGQHAPALRPLAEWVPVQVAADSKNIGLFGHAAGPHVHVVDRLGLADPIASRLRLDRRGRPGHEKELPDAWIVARFAPAESSSGGGGGPSQARQAGAELGIESGPEQIRDEVQAGRAALRCGDLAELLAAIEAPLSLERFGRNVRLAWRLSVLRLPANTIQAQAELCREGGA